MMVSRRLGIPLLPEPRFLVPSIDRMQGSLPDKVTCFQARLLPWDQVDLGTLRTNTEINQGTMVNQATWSLDP
jgi:hypothetical protein